MNFFQFCQLYKSKKREYTEIFSKEKCSTEDCRNNNVGDDDFTPEKSIFIDRLMKLKLKHNIFTHANVVDELKTVLLAVRSFCQFKILFNE